MESIIKENIQEKKNPFRPRSLFTPTEDEKLKELVMKYKDDWNKIALELPKRNARQCKDRYITYLRPDIKIGAWTFEEDNLIISKFNELGNKWVDIAKFLKNRTDTAIKNRYIFIKHKFEEETEKLKSQGIILKNPKFEEQHIVNEHYNFFENSLSNDNKIDLFPQQEMFPDEFNILNEKSFF